MCAAAPAHGGGVGRGMAPCAPALGGLTCWGPAMRLRLDSTAAPAHGGGVGLKMALIAPALGGLTCGGPARRLRLACTAASARGGGIGLETAPCAPALGGLTCSAYGCVIDALGFSLAVRVQRRWHAPMALLASPGLRLYSSWDGVWASEWGLGGSLGFLVVRNFFLLGFGPIGGGLYYN